MAHHELRNDKTCLNCFHVVENRFCPNCGQENTETRKSFGHLITHFAEDFTHYDNAFWTTIRNLLFKPAYLTKEYLSGKRQRFVPPVKLYIFISFLAFFLLSILPKESESVTKNKPKSENKYGKDVDFSFGSERKKAIDSLRKLDQFKEVDFAEYTTIAEYDSVQKLKPVAKRAGMFERYIEQKIIKVRGEAKKGDFKEKFKENLFHNFPKALFLYMPFFALGLWIFHGKKWFYFDHGIFTLHYFSFMLFTFSIASIIKSISNQFDSDSVELIDNIKNFGLFGWWFFYFFRSHRIFYGESRLVSRTKSFALFFINMFFISIFLLGLIILAALTTH